MLLAHDDAPDNGAAPAVLLLHAGVADRRMWSPVAGHLTHAFHVISPDLRGYGDTPLPPEEYADADDVAALLDHLGIQDAAVVGASYGGRVALELTARHPARVRQLVLLNPALRGIAPTADARAVDEAETALLDAGDVEGAVRLNITTYLGAGASLSTREALAGMQRHAFEVQLAADEDAERTGEGPRPVSVDVDLARIAVPTLVVSGAHDLDHFREVARHIARTVPGAEHVELPWAAHLPSLERPGAVVTLLLDALRDDPDVHAP
ncbi:alpha/beta hydrolase fold protein [Xylanimonas cellulosilytica DSM 15894]|uniref:Alpha/beta hydrolase fold protein n=1 Tax=Xylanimonas cellulosilytica (strain DSM 15894 / JCM 12276 / CECT 5975 / KCTC 9989 / LMG 20990 / NBRC 107835 / XIL07) TaxID=446471 RepID=D1BSU2_XYLCX|nr:alpha/beta fold hydrolase [Xylanimonas cellulosilytica]ACZ30784.1 alpha/beta hydrolase fold protein [Xylanimonas cellulosilytica DSM 15894]